MRLVQATIPPGALSEVKRLLQERGVDFFATGESATDEYESVLYFSVPRDEVESVVADLYDAGLDGNDHIVLLTPDVDIHGESRGERGAEGKHKRVAASELKGKVENLTPDIRTYLSMVVLSAIVVTTGLLINSVAVVVGSMVIAPLFGPAISASVGTVVDEDKLFKQGVKHQIIGVVAAIASATLFAWTAKVSYFGRTGFTLAATAQIADRLSPDVLTLVVALVAGIAGVLSIATGSSVAIVGVMMAAALLPPAAIVGIAFAWGEPLAAINAAVLLVVNVLAINFSGLVTLWYLGYRPGTWVEVPRGRKAIAKRAAVLLVGIIVISGFLVNVTYANVQQTNVQNAVQEEVEEILNQPPYQNVVLINVKAIQEQGTLFKDTERVVVTIGRPPGEPRPGVRQRIDSRVREKLGRNVQVTVRVVLVYAEESGTAVSRPLNDINRGDRQLVKSTGSGVAQIGPANDFGIPAQARGPVTV